MKHLAAILLMVLICCFATPTLAGAQNIALEISACDLYVSVPLCTYWCDLDEYSITPVVTVTNLGFSPIAVSGVRLPDSAASIEGVPCEIAQSTHKAFMLTAPPQSVLVPNQAVKQAIIFTISKTGG
jgi:hypothetical protein